MAPPPLLLLKEVVRIKCKQVVESFYPARYICQERLRRRKSLNDNWRRGRRRKRLQRSENTWRSGLNWSPCDDNQYKLFWHFNDNQESNEVGQERGEAEKENNCSKHLLGLKRFGGIGQQLRLWGGKGGRQEEVRYFLGQERGEQCFHKRLQLPGYPGIWRKLPWFLWFCPDFYDLVHICHNAWSQFGRALFPQSTKQILKYYY